MDVRIRQMTAKDRDRWARLRVALWPEEPVASHAAWIDGLLREGDWGFVAETPEGAAIGFAEVALRKFANGCETAPVPFVEGIWVRSDWRRRGVARRLLQHIEEFLSDRDFTELGSDAQLSNSASHAAHAAWGFTETERVVYFRKKLAS